MGETMEAGRERRCIYCRVEISAGDVCERCAFEPPPLSKAGRRAEKARLRKRNKARQRAWVKGA